MGGPSHKDPKTGKDTRYDLIPVLVGDEKIQRLSDIFKFVPKTVVARDVGMRLDSWEIRMGKLDGFTIKKLFEIADLCGLTERQMIELFLAEWEAKKAKIERKPKTSD